MGLLGSRQMILLQEDLKRLLELKHRSPHEVLGMHPLADGSGLLVRAFLPYAIKVEVQAADKSIPAFELEKVNPAGVFEGVTTATPKIFTYELVVTDGKGQVRRSRDPYSFLPTLSEQV